MGPGDLVVCTSAWVGEPSRPNSCAPARPSSRSNCIRGAVRALARTFRRSPRRDGCVCRCRGSASAAPSVQGRGEPAVRCHDRARAPPDPAVEPVGARESRAAPRGRPRRGPRAGAPGARPPSARSPARSGRGSPPPRSGRRHRPIRGSSSSHGWRRTCTDPTGDGGSGFPIECFSCPNTTQAISRLPRVRSEPGCRKTRCCASDGTSPTGSVPRRLQLPATTGAPSLWASETEPCMNVGFGLDHRSDSPLRASRSSS